MKNFPHWSENRGFRFNIPLPRTYKIYIKQWQEVKKKKVVRFGEDWPNEYDNESECSGGRGVTQRSNKFQLIGVSPQRFAVIYFLFR